MMMNDMLLTKRSISDTKNTLISIHFYVKQKTNTLKNESTRSLLTLVAYGTSCPGFTQGPFPITLVLSTP